jgi:predicted O-methyltransferase YrrM
VVNTEFFGGHSFWVDNTEFVSGYGASTVDRFCVFKTSEQLDFYLDLCRTFASGAIVELGIAAGGSAALLALVAKPRKLVALELSETPVVALQELIEREHLEDSVRAVYGVDQADRDRLIGVINHEFGPAPLDLVIDDASHLLTETTSSFETLFPFLRPNGLYVIEDWNSAHALADGVGGASKDGVDLATPLSPLLMELLLVRASSGDVVRELVIGDLWATVRRGPAVLDPRTFRVRGHYKDHFGLVSPTWK